MPNKGPCSHDQMMIRLARQIASLERRQRNLKRELKIIAADLRTRRRELKAISQELADKAPGRGTEPAVWRKARVIWPN